MRNRKIEFLVSALLKWYSANARDLPWRREPFRNDPYCVYVSEIMLQQTQVKTVIPYWQRWMGELPTIQSLAKAPPEKIHKLWEGLGYYTRVRNMQKAAQMIVETHGGKFPDNFEDVLSLPGIGRYTAGAICSIAFNQATPIVDGNVIRVLTRLYGIAENPRDKQTNAKLWQMAEALVQRSTGKCSELNQSLMELGALVCTPQQPQCGICPVKTMCVAHQKNCVETLPNLGKRQTATARRFVAFVVERRGKFFVQQRPANVVNGHLWEFPNVEVNATGARRDSLASDFQLEGPSAPLCRIKHSITRYRITLEAFRAKFSSAQSIQRPGEWRSLDELQRLAFPSAHRQILEHLINNGSPLSDEKSCKVSQ